VDCLEISRAKQPDVNLELAAVKLAKDIETPTGLLGIGTFCVTSVRAAANGADLVALRVARQLGIRCRVVLPFSANRFRRVSVTDRQAASCGDGSSTIPSHELVRITILWCYAPRPGRDDEAFESANSCAG
jgi:hypothetical protein